MPTFTFTGGTAVQNSSATTSVSITPTNNSLLCISAQQDISAGDTFTCTATGHTFTLAASENGNGCANLWTTPITTGGSSITINVTSSQGSVSKDVFPFYITQSDSLIPVVGAVATTTSTVASLTVTSTQNQSRALLLAFTALTTPPTVAGQTTMRGATYGGEGVATYLLTAPSTGSGQPMTLSVTSNMFAGVAVEIIPGTASLVSGSGAATLGALTASATGKIVLPGVGSAALGALTASAAGLIAIGGSAAAGLGALSASATGLVAVGGTGSAALGVLTASAAGTVASTLLGVGSANLGSLSASAAGSVTANTAVFLFTPPLITQVIEMAGSLRVSYPQSETVWKDGNGVWQSQLTPSADVLLAGLRHLSVSGRPEIVDAATAAELTAAGIGTVAPL